MREPNSRLQSRNNVLASQRMEPSERQTTQYSRSRVGPKSIQRLNEQIQKTNKSHQQSYNEVQSHKEESTKDQNVVQKIRKVLRQIKNFASILEYEYELTLKSDSHGFVSKAEFMDISYEMFGQFMKKQDLEELYEFSLEDGKLHTQMYINYLRD